MYKVTLNPTGEMLSFCNAADAVFDSLTYYDAPEGFDPSIHSCKMEGETLITIPSTVIIVDAKEIMIQKVMKAYQNHTTNGVLYFERMRAKLVLGYKTKQMTLEQCIGIESALKDVKSVVITGDWLTASEAAKLLQPTLFLTQPLITRITNDITTYISNNY